MTLKILVKWSTHNKEIEDEHELTIKIDSSVDYGYFRALFEVLLERGYNFELDARTTT